VYPSVAARTRHGHERGGSLLQLAQRQEESPKHASVDWRRPRAEAAAAAQERGGTATAQGRSPPPAGVPRTTRRRSIMDKSSAWADGSVLAWPQGNSAREQMASRWPGGGNDAAAPAVTTSSDSGRAQDWQQRRCGEQAPWPVQERGGEDWRGSALVSPTHAAVAPGALLQPTRWRRGGAPQRSLGA
jgi:hypothetical protein